MPYSVRLLPCSKLEGSKLWRKVEIVDTEDKGEIKVGEDVLAAGLLIKGIIAGTRPETGVAGTICS